MKNYVALLRGINVSGKHLIRMQDLTILLSDIGLVDIRTYIQSGNLVFKSEETVAAGLALKISDKIRQKYSFEVPVLVLLREELIAIRDANPFINYRHPADRLYLTLLQSEPDYRFIDKIKEVDYAPDSFIMLGRAIYLHCPGGYGNTKLNNTFFEKKLGQTATTRNWATVVKLCSM